ncbi:MULTISPECIES: sensor histidine kinase [Prauserella salsuginis group]|uniref:histidine kinase n=2 Tax=Prauserella salsuginis group TaxID=2893672 RepID=A0A839XSI9_9PSEU|nr:MULTISPECIES: PAS domain-containing sensor histidine kinase [Prauserella salsuginis group]MBB3663928.1 two-component sensor histidine kinase [Prauserella sediminis]MCR3721385.1 Two-component sensor histidine kinase, contains HisKA and HATPase domains [Prauserella flava]MCR3732375.1 Two-component sensor histidine kinase, contains HisKA and HATPase domains [Prauserella salsuginis]
MSTLAELLADNTGLPGEAVDHLQLVVAEWQLLADLSFADFLMWVPVAGGDGDFVCVAQVRPTTGPTAHVEDVVGTRFTPEEHPQLSRAARELRLCREEEPHWYNDLPMRREAIPVRFGDRAVAVLSRDTNLASPRVPSPLEIAYLGSAADLCQMLADGTYPSPDGGTDVHTSPRVGDGLIRVDQHGTVVFASPNGQSVYHRMGYESDLIGARLAPLTRSLIRDPFDATEISHRILDAIAGKPSTRAEAESRRGAVALFRALPLRPAGRPAGALVLARDVTEVKRRDRALMSKDATIREIHHRVKNNLQTVAALLRLQSRRTPSGEARQALTESVRRVSSIAMVHEALSMSVDEKVDLDKLFDNVLPMVGEVATAEAHVKLSRSGSFGVVAADIATPLVMVVAELVQNAVEHAFEPGKAGEVEIAVDRSAGRLDIAIRDDGRGLPPGFSLERADGLGLQIARTLVESELRGSLSLRGGSDGGTEATLRVPLNRRG